MNPSFHRDRSTNVQLRSAALASPRTPRYASTRLMVFQDLTSKTLWPKWATKVWDAAPSGPGKGVPSDSTFLPHLGLNRLLDGFSTRGATAVCTFAFCPGPGMEPVLFEGKTEGTIVPARGSTHFGWDAVFQPSGTNLTSVGSTLCGPH
jgi:hypothetical protein